MSLEVSCKSYSDSPLASGVQPGLTRTSFPVPRVLVGTKAWWAPLVLLGHR